MGTDHFLGEIVVPLREVEEVEGSLKEADLRRYTLGRRSAKDKVRKPLDRVSQISQWPCNVLLCVPRLSAAASPGVQPSARKTRMREYTEALIVCSSSSLPQVWGRAMQVKGELNMACCWRVTPLDSVAIRARSLAAEVAQKEDMLALLAEQTLDCSPTLPLQGSSSAGNLQSLVGRKGLLRLKVSG